MLAVAFAVLALVAFLVAFLVGLAGTTLGFDLVTLGFVFVACWMLVRSLPPRRVP